MALTNMQLDAEEAQEQYGMAAPKPEDMPKYPYGLCLCLDDSTLEKLGITSLPKPGDTVMITAKAVVRSVSANAQMDGDSEASVSLQITDMQLDPAKADSAARTEKITNALWGSKE